ncbi:MAG: polysaccharide pyruvyl transferase CsaB [Candidatus Margulisbacteria bacterium]|nr:polysaccharide pyruvyl transferase CsaB [Candidatus Margulisiibacteriota bacterium]
MKVLISGYYGFGNVGDESVLQAIVAGLRQAEPEIKITVLSASPKVTQELNNVKSIHRYKWLKLLQKMIKTDVFISGGGTLFQDVTSSRSFWYYLGLVLLAKLLFKKVMVMAQGFGPLQGRFNRLMARLILNRVNLITVRDSESFEALKQLGIKRPKMQVTADPSFILKEPRLEDGRRVLSLEAVRLDRPLLGIAVRSVPKKDEERLYKTLSEVVDWLARTYNYAPVFILYECPQDMGESSKVSNHMLQKSNVIFRICRPDEMLSVVANFDLLIGMRLHSLIFAAINQVPMLGISYDPKVEAFMADLKQPFLKIDQSIDFKRLRDALEWIVANKAKIKANLATRKQELRELAERNFKLFFEQLAK